MEITEACQYKCRFCYNYWRSAPAATHVGMSAATVDDVVDFLARCSDSFDVSVAVAGGDPTAHPQFAEIVERSAETAPDVCVVTHGGALAAQDVARFAERRGVSIQFSLPSLDARRYARLMGSDTLDRALTSVAMCRQLGVPLSLSVVVTAINRDDVDDLVHLAADVEADYIVVNRFIPEGRGALYDDEFSLSDEAFETVLASARGIARERGVRLLASGHASDIRARKAADPKVTVSANGEIRVCSLSADVLASVRDDPRVIVERSTAFWSSTRSLPGCTCSGSGAGG